MTIGPVAIHKSENSFAGYWIDWCQSRSVPFKVVSGYDTDILRALEGCCAFLWHFNHGLPTDLMMARHVLRSARMMGLRVFPDENTCWHFDDKVAQKYALEAVDAPLVPSWVFYDSGEALAWAETADYPLVFKLRRGSGGRNVRLVRSKQEAAREIRQAFAKGNSPSGTPLRELDKFRKHYERGNLVQFVQGLPAKVQRRRLLDRTIGRERGYVFFQSFMANNSGDTRVNIIGERAFAFSRENRPGDFRASGSGRLRYEGVDRRFIDVAYEVAGRLESQSIAFDFLLDAAGQPRIGEISYGYDSAAVHACPGHWRGRRWVEGQVWPGHAIIEDLLEGLYS